MGVAGRQQTVEEEEFGFTMPRTPLRPAQCRGYMRRTLAEQFPYILMGLVKGARAGSCQHVKLAAELLQPQQAPKPRERDLAKEFMDCLEQERAISSGQG